MSSADSAESNETRGTHGNTASATGGGQGQHRGREISVYSPYYLHPSEGPSTVITPVQLRGHCNYEEWAKHIPHVLNTKRKLGFIDGTVMKPRPEDVEYVEWGPVNSMLVEWIFNTIEPQLRSTMSIVEEVRDLWEDLKYIFSVGNGPRVHQIRSKLLCCKQQGQTVLIHFRRLKKLWDELDVYKPLRVCTCGLCRCNELSAEVIRDREEERVHLFLLGLDASRFRTIRSTVLAMEPLPNLNWIYSMMIQEERQHTMTRIKEDHVEAVGFTAQTLATASAVIVKDKQTLCSHCHKPGHDASSCFKLIGYPDWLDERNRKPGTPGTSGRGRTRGNNPSRDGSWDTLGN